MRIGRRVVLLASVLAVASCGGGAARQDAIALASVDVVVEPASILLTTGASTTFTASVTGVADTAVSWSVREGAAGGEISSTGVYTAPSEPGTYHVVATSSADPTRSATATVSVSSVASSPSVVVVTISPTGVLVPAGSKQDFTCTVSGTTDGRCSFAVQEGSAGGTVDVAGRYSAPATPGTYHVVASSRADATKSAVATVVVTSSVPAPSVAIAIAPTTVGLLAGRTQQFACHVTGSTDTSCSFAVEEGNSGGIVNPTSGAYTAPDAAGTYHVRATSHADPTKSAVATVTVTAPPPPTATVAVTISPTAVSLVAGAAQDFVCTVTGTSDTACTFSVQEVGGGTIDGSGKYTAPGSPGTYHVVAVSRADPTKNSVAAVTVPIPTPTISISVTPGGASLAACQAVTLSAIVSGTTNQIVNWSVAEGAAGGSITSQGVYTAPAAAGTYHVIAQSQADASKAQMVALVVHESILGVSVTPASVTLQPGQTVQFEATVTTTCGAYSTSSTVTPG
jgi:hypothetical protein